MYKCCWNCVNGFTAACADPFEVEKFNATKRFCCASYPVSSYAQNPFKRRYCRQFEKSEYIRFGHEISKEEANKLLSMNEAEIVAYWKDVINGKEAV